MAYQGLERFPHVGQWARVQLAGIGPQLQHEVYHEENFSVVARHYFSDWIEAQDWDRVNTSDPGDAAQAENLFRTFLAQVEDRIRQFQEQGDFVQRLPFDRLLASMTETYGQDPIAFVRRVQYALNAEQALLDGFDPLLKQGNADPTSTQREKAIERELHQTGAVLEHVKLLVRGLQERQESLIPQVHEFTSLQHKIQTREAAMNGQALSGPQSPEQAAQELSSLRSQWSRQHEHLNNEIKAYVTTGGNAYTAIADFLNSSSAILASIVEELTEWQQLQYRTRGCGANPGSLDKIQRWLETLVVDNLWPCRQQIHQLQHQKTQLRVMPEENDPQVNQLCELDKACVQIITQLICKSFIVENQPPLVVKQGVKLTGSTKPGVSVRMLAGSKLTLHVNSIEVTAHLITAKQASTMQPDASAHFNKIPKTSSEMSNNVQVMCYDNATNVLSADFKLLSLKSRPKDRTRSASGQCVAEERLCLAFKACCKTGSSDVVVPVMAISAPLVMVVHANQSVAAEATMFWDCAFTDPRTLVPCEIVEWGDIAHAMSAFFKRTCSRGLTDEQVHCIYRKVFPKQDYDSSTPFSIHKLHRENLPGLNFSFWSWISSAADAVKKRALEMWHHGLIEGFLTRDVAEAKLREKPLQDTFLLRFSETVEGEFAISYSHFVPGSGGREVTHVRASNNSKDYEMMSLPDRLRSLENLTVLYPNTPKDYALAKYYTPNPDQDIDAGEERYSKKVLFHASIAERKEPGASSSSGNSSGDPCPPCSISSPCGSTQLSPGTLQALSPTTSMSMGEQPPLSSGPQVPMSMESMVQEPAFGMIPPQLAVPAQPLMMNSFLLNGSHCMTTVTPHQFAATSMGMREPSSSTS